jgi:hypothetical protein
MSDVVTVFDKHGKPLTELDVSVTRHMKLDHTIDADRGAFTIPVSDPKATEINLRRNNFVYVISDQPGIQPFCGIIWYDENTGLTENTNGEYVVTLRGSEWLLGQRFTAPIEQIKPEKSPGTIFIELLKAAQRPHPFPPLTSDYSNINLSGALTGPIYNLQNIYDIVNKLADDNDMFWHFDPSRDSTGKLVLTPCFRAKLGRSYGTNLIASSNGGGGNLVGGNLYERSINPFANSITAYGQAQSWQDAVIYTDQDDASVGLYGIVMDVVPVLTATKVAELIPAVARELKLRRHRLYVDGTLINVSAFPVIGDKCLTQPDYQGSYLENIHGSILRTQVKETAYTPINNSMAVLLEEVFDDE